MDFGGFSFFTMVPSTNMGAGWFTPRSSQNMMKIPSLVKSGSLVYWKVHPKWPTSSIQGDGETMERWRGTI